MQNKTDVFLPLHGGDIVSASQRYDIAIDDWIDLSTGINSEHYPVDNIPLQSYCRLPYITDTFTNAVNHYYLADNKTQKSLAFLAVAGTQVGIQALPSLLAKFPVLLPKVGYQEHRQHWQKNAALNATLSAKNNSNSINDYPSLNLQEAIEHIHQALTKNNKQHIVIINPNNPTGLMFDKKQLLSWANMLHKDAYLIVDEAFIDSTPENSLLNALTNPALNPVTDPVLPHNIIVLRSFGKFFGLAGIRLGFVFSNKHLIQQLANAVGIWQVNGPAQSLAIAALQDKQWQEEAIIKIKRNANHTQDCCQHLISLSQQQYHHHHHHHHHHHSDLFSSYFFSRDQAISINHSLALSGILTRVIELDSSHAILRIGTLSAEDKTSADRLSTAIDSLRITP
ncbi:MAG: cobalamin biosynthetic protein CobC [Candidatus Endobugula sp.]|jgi:cobalamin biosynthetic protein CobC